MSHSPSSAAQSRESASSSGRGERAFSALIAGIAAALGVWSTWHVVARCGELTLPLDDSYIHFQYARAFAELHPFAYSRGAVPSAGTTSLLWPTLLAPFWTLGFRGSLLAWPAIGIGFATLGLLALETRRLAQGLVGTGLARMAAFTVLGFAPFTWFAASGMEVVPFAWLLTRSTRVFAEYVEREPRSQSGWLVVVHAALCALARPEGAMMCFAGAACVGWVERRRAARAIAMCLGSVALPHGIYWLGTGSPFATTAAAKWLPLNPYSQASLWEEIGYHVRLFFVTLLNGEEWSWIFVPSGGRWIAYASIGALSWCAIVRRAPRAWLVLWLGSAILLPTSYETFLVNRLRYLWPFASAWLVALLVLLDVSSKPVHAAYCRWRGKPRAALPGAPSAPTVIRVGTFACSAVLVAWFAAKLPRALEDLAESADAIRRQHISIARWVHDTLPADATIGVNDTGAIAYFGEHPTFDVVGLTTRGEARHWTAGAGSRFEHYERLGRAALPDYFVIYPEWFGLPELLGPRLTERYVNATILGGHEKVAYLSDYSMLDSGARPQDTEASIVDELDVADLESEAAHHYVLGAATRTDNQVFSHHGIADGGRARRTADEFVLECTTGGELALRIAPSEPMTVALQVGPVNERLVLGSGWQERRWRLPPGAEGHQSVRLVAESGEFSLSHVWSLAPDGPAR